MKIAKISTRNKKIPLNKTVQPQRNSAVMLKATKTNHTNVIAANNNNSTKSLPIEELKALFLATLNIDKAAHQKPIKSELTSKILGLDTTVPNKVTSNVINNGRTLKLSGLVTNEEVKQNIDFNLSADSITNTNKALMKEYDVPLDLTKVIPDMFECFSDNLTAQELAIAKNTGAIVNAASKNAQLGISIYDNNGERDDMNDDDDLFDFNRYDSDNNLNFSSSKNEIKNLIQRQKNNNSWRNDPNYTPGRSSIANGMYFYENDNLNINGRKAKLKIENDQMFISYPNENVNLELTYSDYPYEYGPSPKITYEKDGKQIEAEYTSFNIDRLNNYYETDLATGQKIREADIEQETIPGLGAGDRGFAFFTTFNNNFLLTSLLNDDDVLQGPEEFILYSKGNQPFFRLEGKKEDYSSEKKSPSLNIFPQPNILQKLVFNPNGEIENTVSLKHRDYDVSVLNLNNGEFSQNVFHNDNYGLRQVASIDYKKNNAILEPVNINLQDNKQINLDSISINSLLNLLVRRYPSNTLSALSKAVNNTDFDPIVKIESLEMNNNTIQKKYFNNEDENLNPKDYIIDLNSQGVRIEGTDKNHYNLYDSENNLAYTFQNENGVKTYTKYYPAINIKSDIITVNETDKQNPKYSIDLYGRNNDYEGTQDVNLFIKKLYSQAFFNQNTDTESMRNNYNYLKSQYNNLANNAYQEIEL